MYYTLPGDSIRLTKSLPTTLTQNTLHSSKSINSTQSYRNKRKEIHYRCLTTHKCYKLPLPKSVPHIPRSFFTEHLFINCVFNDELVTGKSETENKSISNLLGNQNKETSCSNTKFNSIFRKPKIPAPDFKLRESRKALHNCITKSSIVLSVKQSSKRHLDFINNLLNKKSHETVSRKKIKIKTLKNQKSTYNLNHSSLKSKDLNNTIITDTVTQTTHCHKNKTDSSVTCRSAVILDIPKTEYTSCDIVNQHVNKNLENKNKFLFLKNDLTLCNEKDNNSFTKNCNEHHHNKNSELKNSKSYKESSSKTPDTIKDSFIVCNQLNIKNQKSKSEDLSKNLSNKEINRTLLQSNINQDNSTTRLKKFGFAFVHSTKILNEHLCNVYTCIIKKIDAYLQLSIYKSFENSMPNNYPNNNVLYKMKNCNFHVAFSQTDRFSDKSIQPSIQNSVQMENNNSNKKKSSLPKSSCSCQPTKSNLQQKKYKNISESLFYGPTLDEVVLHLFGFIRYIGRQLGLIREESKPQTYCCGDTRCNKETCDMPCDVGRNNTDVVKWLHDEYINLAKDIAETNNELQHNCPCVQENNCPLVLQSRRFVLDRLAELLEKKQELEIAYRRNERKALSNNPNTEETQKRCTTVCK